MVGFSSGRRGGGLHRVLRLTGSLAYFLLLAATALSDNLPQPPEPNPADPVDYVKWWNEVTGAEYNAGAAAHIAALEDFSERCERQGPWDSDWNPALERRWSGDEYPELAKWLDEVGPSLEQFAEVAGAEDVRLPLQPPEERSVHGPRYSDAMINAGATYMRAYRDVARALIADGLRRRAGDEGEPLLVNVRTVLLGTRPLLGRTSMIGRLCGISDRPLAYRGLLIALEESDDRPAFARRALTLLRECDQEPTSWDWVLLHERLLMIDFLQRQFIEPQRGGWVVDTNFIAALGDTGDGGPDAAPRPLLIPADFDKALGLLDDFYRDLNECIATGEASAVRRIHELEHEWDRVPKWLRELNLNWSLTLGCLPSYPVAYRRQLRLHATRRATRIVLLLHVYRADHGEFPATLTDVPALRDDPAARRDPFSERDFAYRRTADGFRLHSWAENLQDDAGRHDRTWRDGDYVFWPLPPTDKEDQP